MHIRKLQQKRFFRDAKFVVIYEANYGREASRFRDTLRSKTLRNVVLMHERKGDAGTWTTNEVKQSMAYGFANALRDGLVAYTDSMVSIGHEMYSEFRVTGMECEECIDELQRQLAQYMELTIPAKTEGGTPSRIFSGKHAGADDLAICIQQLHLFRNHFLNSSDYEEFH